MAKIIGKNDGTQTGCVQMFSGSSVPPQGWLYCNGQAVSRTTYAKLFAAIGTTYGTGNGSTTFNLPDFRAMFPRGSNMGTVGGVTISDPTFGVISYTPEAISTRRADQFQGHRHGIRSATNPAGTSDAVLRAEVVISPDKTSNDPITDGVNGLPRTGSETRPANIAIAFMIKI